MVGGCAEDPASVDVSCHGAYGERIVLSVLW